MPPKKRGNLGRSTPIAKARRVSRTDETEEEADARRESARLRIAEVRPAETPDETERRLETARVRIAELRSSEKQGERARRLETKRARFTETISEESSDQKERRLHILYYKERCIFVCLVSMESHTVQLTHMTFILSEPGWAWAGFTNSPIICFDG